jgi:hypothetical protein
MANVKISNLTAATTPVAGTEVLPIVQSGATVKVSIANLTAGRSVSATGLALAGSTSGTVTLAAKAVAGSTTFRLPAADGTSNQAMVTDGSGNLSFATIAATPGGSTTQVQYNNAGAFAGSANLIFDGSNLGVGVTPSAWGSGSKAIQINRNPAGSVTTIAIGDQSNEGFISRNAYHNGTSWIYLISDIATRYELNSSGGFRWYTAASGTAGTAITFTQSLAIEKAKSLALEGATSQTGTGITFPATQSASTNANTLDDYEEGTWTPTLITTGTNFTSVTYNAVTSGKYTKIGNMVYVQGIMETTAVVKGSASGFPLIGGLPFSKASDNQFGMFAAMQRSGWSTNVPNTGIVSATTIYLQYTTAANGATSYSAISDISTTTNQIYFGACYNV